MIGIELVGDVLLDVCAVAPTPLGDDEDPA